MEKYYTPEIEEFHVGFEFEHKINNFYTPINNAWAKCRYFTESLDKIFKAIELHTIRVKYLDREDIESFGFEDISIEDRIVFKAPYKHKRYDNHIAHIILNDVSGWVLVCVGDDEIGYDDWDTLFAGFIKNKSELKRLLKQLGI